jgi:hypothetical protein
MSYDEIIARLAVLEVFTMTSFGLHLAIAKVILIIQTPLPILDSTREAVTNLTVALSPAAQAAATAYSDYLLSILAENLRNLRGEGGRSH